ncbi:MAG: hypothetical protein WDA00_02815 [Eubacteriales bacterium]
MRKKKVAIVLLCALVLVMLGTVLLCAAEAAFPLRPSFADLAARVGVLLDALIVTAAAGIALLALLSYLSFRKER